MAQWQDAVIPFRIGGICCPAIHNGRLLGTGIVFCVDTVVSVRDAWGVRNIVIGLENEGDLEQLQQDLKIAAKNLFNFWKTHKVKIELEHLLMSWNSGVLSRKSS
ncbi:MAG: hypothetical protein ACLUKQ_11110 [Peptococcaceae bacterium]